VEISFDDLYLKRTALLDTLSDPVYFSRTRRTAMDSSLFNLISKAGSMSLGELAARTSADSRGLGQELAEMVQSGRVSLLVEDSRSQQSELDFLKNVGDLPNDKLATALAHVFSEGSLAEAVTIIPTTQGYRFAIS
jgi:hypothetical protein